MLSGTYYIFHPRGYGKSYLHFKSSLTEMPIFSSTSLLVYLSTERKKNFCVGVEMLAFIQMQIQSVNRVKGIHLMQYLMQCSIAFRRNTFSREKTIYFRVFIVLFLYRWNVSDTFCVMIFDYSGISYFLFRFSF